MRAEFGFSVYVQVFLIPSENLVTQCEDLGIQFVSETPSASEINGNLSEPFMVCDLPLSRLFPLFLSLSFLSVSLFSFCLSLFFLSLFLSPFSAHSAFCVSRINLEQRNMVLLSMPFLVFLSKGIFELLLTQ